MARPRALPVLLLALACACRGAPTALRPLPGVTTFLFASPSWWETEDQQLTSTLTQLALAANISATAVLPLLAGAQGGPSSHYSLFGDFYNLTLLQSAQPAQTLTSFLSSPSADALRALADAGALTFTKASQQRLEASLRVLSGIAPAGAALGFGMPRVDPERTDAYCDALPGTAHMSGDGRLRFVFVDRLHAYAACAEMFLPWWYDVRASVVPRREYMQLAQGYVEAHPRPFVFAHVRDLMDHHRVRGREEVEGYALQIADALRGFEAVNGTLYLGYPLQGSTVAEVAELFEGELPAVRKCMDLFMCGRVVPPEMVETEMDHEVLFGTHAGAGLVETAVALVADHFVGNIFSTRSKNVALHRKMNGRTYEMLKGFGELRRVSRWRL